MARRVPICPSLPGRGGRPVAGVVAGYLWYDMTHWWTHAGKPRSAWGKLVRRNHMRHHFKHERYWFAFTWPYFDTWFGTDPDPKTIETSPTVRTLFADHPEL